MLFLMSDAFLKPCVCVGRVEVMWAWFTFPAPQAHPILKPIRASAFCRYLWYNPIPGNILDLTQNFLDYSLEMAYQAGTWKCHQTTCMGKKVVFVCHVYKRVAVERTTGGAVCDYFLLSKYVPYRPTVTPALCLVQFSFSSLMKEEPLY